jgi:hypothetical protein
MNYPRSKLRGIEISSCEFFRFLSPPNVFIRGSIRTRLDSR